jgi:hypothetical protein
MKRLLPTVMALALLASCQSPLDIESPTLYAPENSAVITIAYPAFDWGEVDDASYYQIQIDDASNFESPVIDLTITASAYTPANPLDDGDYWWRVRTWECEGGS